MKRTTQQNTTIPKPYYLAILCFALVFATQPLLAKKGGNGGGPGGGHGGPGGGGGGNEEPSGPADPEIAVLFNKRNQPYQLSIMNADGSHETLVYEWPSWLGSVNFSATENVLIFDAFAHDGQPHTLYRVDYSVDEVNNVVEVGTPVELETSNEIIWDADISPDGDWVVFHTYEEIGPASVPILKLCSMTGTPGSSITIFNALTDPDFGGIEQILPGDLTWLHVANGNKIALNMREDRYANDSLLVVVPIDPSLGADALDWDNAVTLDTTTQDFFARIVDGSRTDEALLLSTASKVEFVKAGPSVTNVPGAAMWFPGSGVSPFLETLDFFALDLGLGTFSPGDAFVSGSLDHTQGDLVIIDVETETITTIGKGGAADWKP